MIEPALDVLSFGEALVDFFPDTPGVPLSECGTFHRHLGGAPANVAVGLARLGARVGLCTLVGPDAFGEFVRARLAAEGVDVRGVGVHRTAKTGVTFVAVAQNGDRSFLFFRHPSADQMIAPHDLDEALLAGARVLHVGSSTLCREPARAATWHAIERARRAGAWISTDPNFRPHLWDDPALAAPTLRELCARADLVKVSDDELPALVGTGDPEAGARAVRALGPRLVVVTLGARGCYYDAAAGQGYLPGERAAVVDSTGAGDGFTAGLLHGLLFFPASEPTAQPAPERASVANSGSFGELSAARIERGCRLGNHLGAKVVACLGATAGLQGLPRLDGSVPPLP